VIANWAIDLSISPGIHFLGLHSTRSYVIDDSDASYKRQNSRKETDKEFKSIIPSVDVVLLKLVVLVEVFVHDQVISESCKLLSSIGSEEAYNLWFCSRPYVLH